MFFDVFRCGVWSYTSVTVSHPSLLFFVARKKEIERNGVWLWRQQRGVGVGGGGSVGEGEEKRRGSVEEKRYFLKM